MSDPHLPHGRPCCEGVRRTGEFCIHWDDSSGSSGSSSNMSSFARVQRGEPPPPPYPSTGAAVPPLGAGLRKRASTVSSVTFASLFGSVDDVTFAPESVSNESTNEVTLMYNANSSRRRFFFLEHTLLIYLVASTLSRLNLLQVFRVHECVRVLELNMSLCRQSLADGVLRSGYINDLAINISNILDGLQYVAGCILVFLCSQYISKYGSKLCLLLCLLGTCLTYICFLFIHIYGVDKLHVWLLAALPKLFTGGEIAMMTMASVHIATSSTGERRRWRFLAYELSLRISQLLLRVLDVFKPPMLFELALWIIPVCLLLVSHLKATCYVEDIPETFRAHTPRQRIRCAFGRVGIQESVLCFTRRRQCKGRRQLILLVLMVAISSAYFNDFSPVQVTFVNLVHGWDETLFTQSAAIAALASFILASVVMRSLSICAAQRPLDPLVIALGFVLLLLTHVAVAVSLLDVIAYYAALALQLAPLIGAVFLRSHLCQHLDTYEVAPVFAVICTLERALPLVSNVLAAAIVTSPIFTAYPYGVFVISAVIFVLPAIASLYIYSITKAYGYPSSMSSRLEEDI